METETLKIPRQLKESARTIFFLSIILKLSTSAFKYRQRREIKNTGGICDGCNGHFEKSKITAAHMNHDRDFKGYHSPENGRAFCRVCEIKHHLKNHKDSFKTIGVNKKNNRGTIYGIWQVLDEEEKDEVKREYSAVLRELKII